MKFLLLHSEPKGLPVIVNTRYIMRVDTNQDGETVILAQRPHGSSVTTHIVVREPISEIAKLLEGETK